MEFTQSRAKHHVMKLRWKAVLVICIK